MSILSGLKDKIKKEVVDKVAEAVRNEVDKAKEAAEALSEKPAGGSGPVSGSGPIPGHTGFVVGGGGNCAPQGDYHEKSWYEDVPDEECQYNYNGTYLEYFSMIFREDFPEYKVLFLEVQNRRKYTYTFLREGKEVLCVELMASACESNKIRRECMARQLPYLRFYFDHNGWWNTRTYVRERVSKALGQN